MAVRGNSGWRYTIPGGTVITLEQEAPLQDVEAGVRVTAYVFDSEDWSTRETVTTSPPVREISARIPIHPDSGGLLTMLAWMVQGVVASYYPDLDDEEESYPSILVDPPAVSRLLKLNTRPYGEWDHRIELRHAEGGTYDGILQRRNSS